MTLTKRQKEVQERRQEWCKDLRDPKRKQTKGKLNRVRESLAKRPVGQCCLGVLADTYKRLTGKGEWVNAYPEDDVLAFKTSLRSIPLEQDLGGPHFTIPRWIGLSKKQERALMNMNDKHGSSFLTIANYIEALPLPGQRVAK